MRTHHRFSEGGPLFILASWTAVAALVAAGYGLIEPFRGFWESLVHFLPYYWIWAALTPAVVHGARRLRPDSLAPAVVVAGHVALGLTVATIQLACYVPLELFLHHELAFSPAGAALAAGVRRHLPGNVLTYACLIAAWYIDDYRTRTAAALTQARVDALRAQLQPHFLFNTLQVASSLIHSDPNAADETLEQLGDFLRLVLRRDDRNLVPIAEELDLLRRYAAIMTIRFGARLRFSTHVEPELTTALVPVLLLQPLVENAIAHGIGDRAQGGEVHVGIRRSDSTILIVIDDDGVGPRPGAPEGIGLRNTRERLAALYGKDYRLAIMPRSPSGTRLEISIPLRDARIPGHASGSNLDSQNVARAGVFAGR